MRVNAAAVLPTDASASVTLPFPTGVACASVTVELSWQIGTVAAFTSTFIVAVANVPSWFLYGVPSLLIICAVSVAEPAAPDDCSVKSYVA